MYMIKKVKSVALPSQISLLVEAFKCDNEDAARLLVKRAMDAVYPHKTWQSNDRSDEELDAVIVLIRGIKPKDTIETILAAQFVALHLQGTANMAQENYNIMGQAIQMIRLSHQSLNMLQQYRGKSQTINVNYNVASQGDTVLNTLIQMGDKEKNGA
jgi:hypothetical protein